MNFILTDLQSTMLELFRRVFYDTEGFRYTKKGMQCYKLYLYMYFWGYVRELDLPYIFCDEKSIHKMSARKTEEMFHGRMIDWVKSEELKRVAEDSYMLTDDGLKKLYDHIKRENPTGFQEISFNSFKESYSRKLINASYISNIGITVLKLSEMIETVFWYAPMLDYEGNMLTNNLDEFRNRFLIPDAVIATSLNEKIFVETDNCKKNLLVSMLKKYSAIMCANPDECIHSTLHFSVFSDQDKRFEGKLKGCINIKEINKVFDDYFMVKQNCIYREVAMCAPLSEHILKGVRMVCLPMHTPNYLLKCVYIEYMEDEKIYQFFLKYTDFKFDKIHYLFDTKNFYDFRQDKIYIFKHVYRFMNIKKEQEYYVAIENISDDYGGRLRVKNYIQNCQEVSEKLYIVCLYNRKTTENPMSLYSFKEQEFHEYKIQFFTYEQFLIVD